MLPDMDVMENGTGGCRAGCTAYTIPRLEEKKCAWLRVCREVERGRRWEGEREYDEWGVGRGGECGWYEDGEMGRREEEGADGTVVLNLRSDRVEELWWKYKDTERGGKSDVWQSSTFRSQQHILQRPKLDSQSFHLLPQRFVVIAQLAHLVADVDSS